MNGPIQRFVLVALAAAILFLAMSWFSFFVVPPWATGLVERGEELPLPTQIVIASANFWARWFVFLAVLLAGLLAVLGGRALRAAPEGTA